MKVTLHKQFSDQLNKLALYLEGWSEETRSQLVNAHKRIGQRHAAEAVKRVPLDEGRLRNSILTHTHVNADKTEILTETGTNVKDYPVYLEFGTKYIAGGRVQQLGEGIEITDAQAVHDWPAKRGAATAKTKLRYKTTVVSSGVEVEVKGRAQEQMPWLRPSFNAIRDWARKQIINAMQPPK